MINLYDYIISGDILSELKGEWTILMDKNIFAENSTTHHIITFCEIFKNPELITDKNIIGISTESSLPDLLAINSQFNIRPIWINLNPGLGSLLTKNNPEENDITTMLGERYQVVEPISIDHLFSSLQQETYIRIHDRILPETLQKQLWDIGFTKIIDTDKHSDYVLISSPAIIDDVVGSVHQLSEHTDFSCNLYIQSEFSIRLSHELIDDIRRTQHVIIIIDHKATEQLWMYYDTLIKEQTRLKEITIQYIFPQFHLVSSILPEYLYEEAQFDQPAFTNYLLSQIQ